MDSKTVRPAWARVRKFDRDGRRSLAARLCAAVGLGWIVLPLLVPADAAVRGRAETGPLAPVPVDGVVAGLTASWSERGGGAGLARAESSEASSSAQRRPTLRFRRSSA